MRTAPADADAPRYLPASEISTTPDSATRAALDASPPAAEPSPRSVQDAAFGGACVLAVLAVIVGLRRAFAACARAQRRALRDDGARAAVVVPLLGHGHGRARR